MTYDDALAQRIRAVLADRPGVSEKHMFGGVGFLVGGNLLCSARGKGGMLVRVGPEGHAAALASPHTTAMAMGGRGMLGYVIVDAEGVASARAVASWVERAWAHVRTLAPKRRERAPAKAKTKGKVTTRTSDPATRSRSRSRTRPR